MTENYWDRRYSIIKRLADDATKLLEAFEVAHKALVNHPSGDTRTPEQIREAEDVLRNVRGL